MTVDAAESGANTGQPREIYDFAIGASHHRHTSADQTVTFFAADYTPAGIGRGPIVNSAGGSDGSVTITCPRDFIVARKLRQGPTLAPVTVDIWRSHLGDTEFALIFSGVVSSPDQVGRRVTLKAVDFLGHMRNQRLRRLQSKNCQTDLYGPQCGLNINDYLVPGVVDGLTGSTVTMTALTGVPDTTYNGGLLRWITAATAEAEEAVIDSQVGPTLVLIRPPVGLLLNQSVAAARGCPHTIAACDSEFGNSLNYRGDPWQSPLSAFDGKTIF